MQRLKETEADLAVKQRLWASTKAELSRFANRYAGEHIIGCTYKDNPPQRDITATAKRKGYPIGLVRHSARARSRKLLRDLQRKDWLIMAHLKSIPQGDKLAFEMDRAGFELFERLLDRAEPRKSDNQKNFRDIKQRIEGHFLAGKVQMGWGRK